MACEAADGQTVQKEVVDVAYLLDTGMADFDVAAAKATFPSESIGRVRWWFLDHEGFYHAYGCGERWLSSRTEASFAKS